MQRRTTPAGRILIKNGSLSLSVFRRVMHWQEKSRLGLALRTARTVSINSYRGKGEMAGLQM